MGERAMKRFTPPGGESDQPAAEPERHALLFERAREGDERAWHELTASFTPLVESVARSVCRSSADVDDVKQEVWLQLLRNAHKIHSPECLPGWLQRVTRNIALRHVDTRRVQLYAELPEECLVGSDDTGHRLMVDASRETVQRALRRLAAADRRLLVLLMEEDRPDYANISRELERPIGSIGPTRQRLLKRLGRDPAIVRLVAS